MEGLRIAAIPVEELVGQSWEGVLHRLTADMDPWDIDISELARRYRDYLQALRELEFEIPGRMVLTCSILLRMKSDLLLAQERATDRDGLVAELDEAVDEALEVGNDPVDPGSFRLPILRAPRRQVTLLDLRTALQGAMTVSRRRAERFIDHVDIEDEYDPFQAFELGGADFSERLHTLLERIKSLLSGRRVLSFFKLLDKGDKEERVHRFFEVLHLAAEGQISCTQKEFLGDISIRLEAEA
ncbi:MAG: segregation/condensation protein A [Candidatus Bipolaricaulota bacterium]|nr:segregation/condensation protein A [Candidatus Bipolaricaulota bacterium]